MEDTIIGKIKKQDARHESEVSKQTGFPSPATHYLEPSIDLNKELTQQKDATFYVRVEGDAWSQFSILNNDVLIIDKAITPRAGDLALVVEEGDFNVIYIPLSSSTHSFTLWGVITYIIHKVK
ncbi:protein impA [Patiriisocius marinistellae]|uniref:Protein impA n=1 Tax=Patiriisocius marinistellae TaxID=2494560 RepID=A0A5J4FVW5_9FLAO|nr:S24 family peptidase [Patiriisocius marinistellae]GEQ86190.1 protein impA [Patiriisocius marinistellae]